MNKTGMLLQSKQLFDAKKITLLGGLEPPAFRLTAERANQLRHKSMLK